MLVIKQLTVAIDFNIVFFQPNAYRQLIDYKYSSKYLFLCLTAERIIHTGLKQV